MTRSFAWPWRPRRPRAGLAGARAFLCVFAVATIASCAAGTPDTLHVAVDGNDLNPGTREAPFRTWQKAISLARPGDTILVQPGVYTVAGRQEAGARISRSGQPGNPIRLRGDGGLAILDCSGLSGRSVAYCLHVEADWWDISDIGVTGTPQNAKGAWAVGLLVRDASNNVFRGVESFRNMGPGIEVTGASRENLIFGCRAYENHDPLSEKPGGNADGVQIVSLPVGATGNRVSGCRSFGNSDDGFDLWKSEAPVTIEGSRSFRNGYVPGTGIPAGDGDGFKLGRNRTGPAHQIRGNVAYDNRGVGFDSNDAAGPAQLTGNRSFNNRGGNWQ